MEPGARRRPAPHPDLALTAAARIHSADLARTGRIGHTGSDGSSAGARAERAGARYRALGETIYQSSLYASGYLRRDADGVITTHYDWIAPADLARRRRGVAGEPGPPRQPPQRGVRPRRHRRRPRRRAGLGRYDGLRRLTAQAARQHCASPTP